MIGIIEAYPHLLKQFIGETEIPYHHDILHGDIVEVVDDKVTLIKRNKILLTGVLLLKGKRHTKVNPKKGQFYKPFKPYGHNYPEMYVSTKKNKENNDSYICAEIKEFDASLNQYRCEIKNYIGNAGDIDSEIDYIRYRNDIRFNYNRSFDKIIEDIKSEKDPYSDIRVDLTKKEVFSIDPIGCIDIDDAVHFEKTDDYIEIGIHIADPESWLKSEKGKLIYNEAKKLTSTLYTPFKNFHMLPPELSTDLCSLLEYQKRRCTSLIIKFNSDHKIVSYEIIKSIIINKKNYSYEEFNEKIISENHSLCYQFVKNLPSIKMEYDSHIFVEKLMIMANSLVAKYLKDKIPENLILRKMHNHDYIDYGVESKINNIINYMKNGSASYTNLEDSDYSHHILLKKEYTYFTSPIRRFLDIYNHELIGNILMSIENEALDKSFIDYLNQKQKDIRKAQQDAENIALVFSIKEKITTIGYVIDFDENNIRVYFESFDLTLNISIISKYIKHLYETIMTDKKISIIRISDEQTMEFYLGEKININVVSFPMESKFRDKLKFSFCEKAIFNLFEYDI